jgi:hypothetical protein
MRRSPRRRPDLRLWRRDPRRTRLRPRPHLRSHLRPRPHLRSHLRPNPRPHLRPNPRPHLRPNPRSHLRPNPRPHHWRERPRCALQRRARSASRPPQPQRGGPAPMRRRRPRLSGCEGRWSDARQWGSAGGLPQVRSGPSAQVRSQRAARRAGRPAGPYRPAVARLWRRRRRMWGKRRSCEWGRGSGGGGGGGSKGGSCGGGKR